MPALPSSRRALATALTLGSLVVSPSGCGSSGKKSTQPSSTAPAPAATAPTTTAGAATNAEFIARADGICRQLQPELQRANKRLSSVNGSSRTSSQKIDRIVAAAGSLEQALQKLRAQIAALGDPPQNVELLHRYLALVDRILTDDRNLQSSAQARDLKGLQRVKRQASADSKAVSQVSGAFGFKVC